jgi:type I restriction enzyme, R subunit
MTTPSYHEDHASQIPAIHMLVNLGYKYLPPAEAVRLRGGKTSGVLLDGILEDQLRKMNRIRFKGEEYAFAEGNIQSAIASLKDMFFDGLVRTNEKLYELLTMGRSLPQMIMGDNKSFPLAYIAWEKVGQPDDPNVYHVTAEYRVDRIGTDKYREPDVVLFVNGIPLCVMECKSPTVPGVEHPIDQAISQMIGYQKDEAGIPRLFVFSQLLMAVAKNEAKYATCGTAAKFWAVWKEREDKEQDVEAAAKMPLDAATKEALFNGIPFQYARGAFEAMERAGGREVTVQDRAIYALCRPARMLELALRYTVFDAGEKKIARYQQYFTVKEILNRIMQRDAEGKRRGGVVWHTQGSGKSLTMVILAENIAMADNLGDYKIVLVTDRVELDDQIYKTFAHCGAEVETARSGTHLGELLKGTQRRIITTIINKFETISSGRSSIRIRNDDPNIFLLVDEAQRGQYGPMHANMRRVLPNACFIGFTGTPVMRKERNTVETFGGIIPPPYTIQQAVEDKAVVPLLYEGRHVEQMVDKGAIDAWFDRVTDGLTDKQKADLKKKFARADQLNTAEQKVMRIAYDIGAHFRDNWKGTGFKGQLVTPLKKTALLYKKYLDEFGMVTSEVLISGPDEREGEDAVDEPTTDAVKQFWQKMMTRYGTDKEYDRQVREAFKHGDEPEIIIVVDKLLVGFDAPRNTVLYLTRKLEDYLLLQTIARVNRLHEGKEFGYIIDYRGVLGALDTAMALYRSLEEYDAQDLEGTLIDVEAYVAALPQRHSDLWAIFGPVKKGRDPEPYERFLADQQVREDFYKALSAYARTLAIALSSVKFLEKTPAATLQRYKEDLKFFANLRTAVRRRYGEAVDFGEYELKIQKLIDTHVGTGEVEKVTPLVNIFDKDAFRKEVEAVKGVASKADMIAYRTKKTISEHMQEDPAFYKKFSEMLEEVIRAFREGRKSELQYLNAVQPIHEAVRDRVGDDLPPELRQYEVAKAFYGVIREVFGGRIADDKKHATDAAIKIDQIINSMKIVNWTTNPDVQNKMQTAMEEFLFDFKKDRGLELSFDDIDAILQRCLDIARVRYAA